MNRLRYYLQICLSFKGLKHKLYQLEASNLWRNAINAGVAIYDHTMETTKIARETERLAE